MSKVKPSKKKNKKLDIVKINKVYSWKDTREWKHEADTGENPCEAHQIKSLYPDYVRKLSKSVRKKKRFFKMIKKDI